MHKSKIISIAIVFFIGFLTMCNGKSIRGLSVAPGCRCTETESRRIGKHLESVELFPPSPHCKETEIIGTLKISGKEICLDPAALWVKKVIDKIIANKSP
ncbi:hypothetical protein QQF64_019857 [Cirrhinus molitorella]|uniref:Uncharacterized protein n=2 Tax=Cirrhinus molitorella TaxID=172907 RepID=A0AA88U2B2_9TELE|nr:hypothetical protein Q8A67_005611 [Cirrhinus molitorella]